MTGLEPLPLRVDQTYQCDRYVERTGGDTGDAIVFLLYFGIQNLQSMKSCNTLSFIF